MMLKNCVVRTWANGYTSSNSKLQELLGNGWVVKFITPFYSKGNTDFVEYILEREE